MGKLVILSFEQGNFNEGFKVRLRIGEDNDSRFPQTEIEGYLPKNLNIPRLYEDWQSYYKQLECGLHIQLVESNLTLAEARLKQCQQVAKEFINQFNNWLKSGNWEFFKVRETIIKVLRDEQEEIRVLVQAEDSLLRELPWNEWDLFDDYSNSEIAISFTEFSLVERSFSASSKTQVRILASLGESPQQNFVKPPPVDTDSRKKRIVALSEPELILLQQLQPEKLYQQLQDPEGWDIIFFTGNSWHQSINNTQLKRALKKALERGLQLAIFNEGLRFAEQLADLNIPQIIVMREPVPDEVAQKFFEYFLKAFANGKFLYSAVREARYSLEPLEKEFPGVTWLPMICQNSTQKSPTWQQLIGRTDTSGNARTHLTRQQAHERHTLLNRVRDYWIEGVLERSLHNHVLIELGLEERPNAVTFPWEREWETPSLDRQTLSSNTRLIDRFDKLEGSRTLLILGEPGSGKTITLLELADELITRAQQHVDQPMPIVFNLSSWTSKKTITDWLVEELKIQYKLTQQLAKNWIKTEQLLLLLDGLDEISEESRRSCVQALNQFTKQYIQTDIVVCSRVKDYEALPKQLRFKASVYLKHLNREQIEQYFVELGADVTALITAWQADANLQELVKSPLMLNVMIFAFYGASKRELPVFSSLEEYRSHLFNAYIEEMFHRRQRGKQQYTRKQFIHWLTWLAAIMSQESRTVFLIEQMQIRWFESNSFKKKYFLLFSVIRGTIIGLIVGGITGLVFDLYFESFGGVLLGIIMGIIVGLFSIAVLFPWAREPKIDPVETINFSWQILTKSLTIGLLAGTIGWLFSKLFIFVIVMPLIVLSFYSRGSRIQRKTYPNQGIWQSFKNTILLSMIAATLLGIAAMLMNKQLVGIIGGEAFIQAKIGSDWMQLFSLRTIISSLILGLFYGLIVTEAGTACIQHFSLRLLLRFNNYTPWNYARFLDSATDQMFLQKVGGGYKFIHGMLQGHFAGLASGQMKS